MAQHVWHWEILDSFTQTWTIKMARYSAIHQRWAVAIHGILWLISDWFCHHPCWIFPKLQEASWPPRDTEGIRYPKLWLDAWEQKNHVGVFEHGLPQFQGILYHPLQLSRFRCGSFIFGQTKISDYHIELCYTLRYFTMISKISQWIVIWCDM